MALVALCACAGPKRTIGPYDPQRQALRNTSAAEQLTKRAAELLEDDPEQAEVLLRQALTEDLFFGPAHNNLGVVFLRRGDLYEAAGEFEWAKKLMPGHPDPRLNLGLTLDRAGQLDEALAAYTSALDVYPGHIAGIQGLARLAIKEGRDDSRLPGWLDRIALEGESEAWREWAARHRAAMADE